MIRVQMDLKRMFERHFGTSADAGARAFQRSLGKGQVVAEQ